jgi:hypothetical protein
MSQRVDIRHSGLAAHYYHKQGTRKIAESARALIVVAISRPTRPAGCRLAKAVDQ